MTNPSTTANLKFCKSLSRFAAIFAIVMGILVLGGWQFDIVFLKSIIVNYKSMNPAAAVCFILLGSSLLIHHFSYNTLRFSIATLCAGLVLLVAISRLGDVIFGFGFALDRLLFLSKLGDNQMASSTAFDFLFLSIALLSLRYPKNLLRQILVILAIMVSIVALVGYVYYVGTAYQQPTTMEIALNAAIALFVLSCGVLCFEPDYGLIGILTEEGISAAMARQLLPGTLIALIVVGWFRLLGQHLGLYDYQFGILIHLLMMMGVLIALIWICALVIGRIDKERQEKAERVYQLGAIVESSEDAIIGKTIDGIITTWNIGAEKIYGYTAAEVIGKPITILVPSHQLNEIPDFLDQIKRNVSVQHFETVRKHKDGHLFDVSIGMSPIKDLHGKIIGASTIIRDITEFKKQREKVLQLSRAVENSPLSIVITDDKGAIEYVNPKFIDLTGYSLSEAIGQNPRILNSGKQSKEFYKNLWDTIQKGDEWHGEFYNKKKNGELYWESASISSLQDLDGNITHFVAVKEDITLHKAQEEKILETARELQISSDDIKILNAELEMKNKQLVQMDHLKDDFVNNVSHELRTPLTIIKESLALVYDQTVGPISAKQKDFLETARSNVDRLARMINSVLDYQKLDTQKIELNITEKNINDTIREVGEGFKMSLKDKELGLEFQLQPDLPLIKFDNDKIVQVLTNLINNAIKFTQKGTIVLITQKEGDNAIRVSVKDEGIGIRQEDLDKLFKAFSQISSQPGFKEKGTGLGLALCKRIVESYEGKIGVVSEFGRGSTFYFILPVQERRVRG